MILGLIKENFRGFLVFAGIAVASYLLWKFMRKKKEIPNHERDELLKLCESSPPTIPQYLYFTGNNEYEKKLVGKVIGYFVEKGKEGKVHISFKEKRDTELLCASKDDFRNLFNDKYKMQYDITEVRLRGMTFKPKKNGIYELAQCRDFTDISVEDEYRYELEECQDDIKILSQKAIDISPHHQKQLESNELFQDATDRRVDESTSED